MANKAVVVLCLMVMVIQPIVVGANMSWILAGFIAQENSGETA
jgi:hypothetical protein